MTRKNSQFGWDNVIPAINRIEDKMDVLLREMRTEMNDKLEKLDERQSKTEAFQTRMTTIGVIIASFSSVFVNWLWTRITGEPK